MAKPRRVTERPGCGRRQTDQAQGSVWRKVLIGWSSPLSASA